MKTKTVTTCERCNGNGQVGLDAVFLGEPTHLVIECPVCKGKGFVKVTRWTPQKGTTK